MRDNRITLSTLLLLCVIGIGIYAGLGGLIFHRPVVSQIGLGLIVGGGILLFGRRAP